MTCNLIRLRCEKRYGLSKGESVKWPEPDHRLFDVPPAMANQIKTWYEDAGWDVIEEPI
jgi:hypothetical protein